MGFFGKFSTAAQRLLGVLARPARGDRGRGGSMIVPYRGYGTHSEIFVIGRVFRQPSAEHRSGETRLRRDFRDVMRRFVRWGAGGRDLIARVGTAEQRVTTDRDGYFRLHMDVDLPVSDNQWHEVDLTLTDEAMEEVPNPSHSAVAHVYVPPQTARLVVISDIDDTIMHTGVASKLMMMWRLFVQTAHARVAFPGVAALCRAFHQGASGNQQNPMLYVSRAPWSIYEVLDEFFSLHRIPVGPILFLREWGLTLQSPLPRRAKRHKKELILNMLALYSELPFVLIGDSGQRDAEIYAQIVEEYPDRVRAIYIRNVSHGVDREDDIRALAKRVAEAGSSLVLANNSFVMAEHAAERGLISEDGLAKVLAERDAQGDSADMGSVRRVAETGRQATADAVEAGELDRKLSDEQASETPANVVVEPDPKKN